MYERLDEIANTQEAPRAVNKAQSEENALLDLAPQIRDARDQFINMDGSLFPEMENRSAVNALVADIGTRLTRLRIPIPATKVSDTYSTVVQSWTAYLSILTPLADVGDIENARAITFREGVVDAPISPANKEANRS